mmetsp:Transcript_555/g.1707  ORF Transcript_555/g.1707 Transcript_555/m.1707 type:complete len:83 (-) Transcript_555:762-1010(-)
MTYCTHPFNTMGGNVPIRQNPFREKGIPSIGFLQKQSALNLLRRAHGKSAEKISGPIRWLKFIMGVFLITLRSRFEENQQML